MKFLVVFEKGKNNYSAYSPDVLGCAATGKNFEETLTNIKDALEFHLESVLESGEQLPAARSLNYLIENTDDISSDDIIAHVTINLPEMALA